MINLSNPPNMATSFKRGFQPDVDDCFGKFECDLTSTQRKDIGIIVGATQLCCFKAPAQCTADAFDAIGNHGFAIAGSSQHNGAVAFASCDRFSGWTDKQRIIAT